jgi:hypothetical protein
MASSAALAVWSTSDGDPPLAVDQWTESGMKESSVAPRIALAALSVFMSFPYKTTSTEL